MSIVDDFGNSVDVDWLQSICSSTEFYVVTSYSNCL